MTLTLKVLDTIKEEIRKTTGNMVLVDTLVCDVTVGAETKTINFNWIDSLELYRTKERLVYVRIPQYGTPRAEMMSEYNIYENKVRKASLYIQNIASEFRLIQRYSVLKSEASILSWTDTRFRKELSIEEAIDDQWPFPIRYD